MIKRYYNPTQIITGEGSYSQLPDVVARLGKRALVVRSPHAPQPGPLLEAAGVGVVETEPVTREPTVNVVDAGLALARAESVEVVVGIGGGSPMDVAKAIAGLFPHPGAASDYLGDDRQVPGGGLPFIAVPTTAGTGAEVTKNAVLIDPAHHVKTSIRHDSMFARAAIVDPELTYSLPPEVTAACGSDALCQAIEAYVSIGAMPVTDALAVEAIRLVGRALPIAYREPGDRQARADMLYGSLLAGLALANARLGGVHGMAHPLGYRFNIPHGVICGLLLPHVMAYNLHYSEVKYAHVADLLGYKSAAQSVEAVNRILGAINLPLRLRDVGVEREAFPVIVEESLPSSSLKHNPRPLKAEDVNAILEAAW